MADKKPPAAPNADFIGRIAGEGGNAPETRMLTGWFGEAGDAGYRRLYTDAELTSYVDIPSDAILYSEPIRDVQPAGGVLVWIRRDAALRQGGSAFSRAARFLQGQVQQDFASGGAKPGAAGQDRGGAPANAAGAGTTGMPGCGYTETWGPCVTNVFCEPGPVIPTNDMPICQPWSRNPACTDLPGCGVQNFGIVNPIVTWVGPCRTRLGCTAAGEPCDSAAHVRCFTSFGPRCRTMIEAGCPAQPTVPNGDCSVFAPCRVGMFGAAAQANVVNTAAPCSAVDACPSKLCGTQPPTAIAPCTHEAACPTYCGANCQSHQAACTSLNCTHAGPSCKTNWYTECTLYDQFCPTAMPACGQQQAAPAAQNAAAVGGRIGETGWFGCTETGNFCRTQPNGDCTFFAGSCPSQRCITHDQPVCTVAGPHCAPTPVTICTRFGPHCPSRLVLCGITNFVACAEKVSGVACNQPQNPVDARQANVVNTLWLTCTHNPVNCPSLGIMCTYFGPNCHSPYWQACTGPFC